MAESSDTPRPGEIKTDYTVGRDNITGRLGGIGFDVHNPVFMISAIAVVLFVVLTLIFPSSATSFFNWLRPALTDTFDWFFLTAANIFLVFAIVLIFTPWGKIRLGGADAEPEFSYPAWFAMLFAAGMGIGLMFYGVVEPITHAVSSRPLGTPSAMAADGSVNPATAGTAKNMGIAASAYHWGLHAWGIYAVVALALALFCYNKGLPLSLRSAFYPLFGEAVWGWTGHIIDTLAVFATLFGLATSLGLGAQQANAGLNYVFGIPSGTTTQVILVIGITSLALFSVIRGIEGGVKLLSEVNMAIAALLLLFVLLAGPTLAILSGFGEGLVSYIGHIIPLSNPIGRTDDDYRLGWTTFYWSWWISWSPFVGMFIARVSRGRTVREFITCVLLIPSLVCVFWMAVFGGAAINQVLFDPNANTLKELFFDTETANSTSLSLFWMLSDLPLSSIASTIGVILVIVFFVTSSDSGSLVIDTITAGGKLDAPIPQRVFWASIEGVVAICLLIGGGLTALQAAVVSTGLPFAIVLLVMCVAIVKGLMWEKEKVTAAPAE